MTSRARRPSPHWTWPDGARAAISLTYDDGRLNHLDMAIPDLEQFGFRGTFYLTYSPDARRSLHRWRAAFSRGHEIGNHSYNHPSKEALSGFDAGDILAEVGRGASWLTENIGPDPERSFAYPHGQTGIGAGNVDRDAYATAISRYHHVARLADGPPNDPHDVRLPLTIVHASGFDCSNGSLFRDMWNYCEAAGSRGHWAVIMFHDVIAGHHPVGNQMSRHVHRQLLSYLRSEKFWVAPVKEVAGYIFQHTNGGGSGARIG